MTSAVKAGPTLIAPVWHTIVVVVALMALSLWSAYAYDRQDLEASGRAIRYAIAIVREGLLVALVWYGIRLRGTTLRSLLGDRWPGRRAILRDIGIAMLFLVVCNSIVGVLSWLFDVVPSQAVRNMAPNGAIESVCWVILAATAGICEEIIFRGYLQTQSAALFNSGAAGVIVQGVVFGASHGYQSLNVMITIAVFGCLFGLLARWRHSLRPGMIAHFLQDGVFGLVISQVIRR